MKNSDFRVGEWVRINSTIWKGQIGQIKHRLLIPNGEYKLDFKNDKDIMLPFIIFDKITQPKFKIGDEVRIGSFTGEPKNPKYTIAELKYEEGIKGWVYLDKDGLGAAEYLLNRVIPLKEKKEEWRPKKGETILVSQKEDNPQPYTRKFKVYMDGKYWCESLKSRDFLSPWNFAKPMTVQPEWPTVKIRMETQQKFKIGDLVKIRGYSKIHGPEGEVPKVIFRITETKWEKGDNVWAYLDKNGMGATEKLLEKVETFDFPVNNLSFRGESKGVMLDKDIVMYYSHKFKRILISEAEPIIPKDIVWIKVNKKELEDGDVVITEKGKIIYIIFEGGFYHYHEGTLEESIIISNTSKESSSFIFHKAVEV